MRCHYCPLSQGLFNGATQILKQNGLLMTYGVRTKFLSIPGLLRIGELQWDLEINRSTLQAYAINGTITPSCNENLDAELRKL